MQDVNSTLRECHIKFGTKVSNYQTIFVVNELMSVVLSVTFRQKYTELAYHGWLKKLRWYMESLHINKYNSNCHLQ